MHARSKAGRAGLAAGRAGLAASTSTSFSCDSTKIGSSFLITLSSKVFCCIIDLSLSAFLNCLSILGRSLSTSLESVRKSASISSSLWVRRSTVIKIFPKESSMSLANPNEFVEVYTAVLAVISAKCSSVDASQTELHTACTKLKAGIINLKAFVAPLNDILPIESDLTNLETLDISNYLVWQGEVRTGANMIAQLEKEILHNFPEDNNQGSMFSPLKLEELKKLSLKTSKLKKDPFIYIMKLSFNNLAQIRGMRTQMQNYFSTLRWVLIISLLPQMILMLFLCINYALNKRKQRKLRKRIKKAQEARELVGRMRNIANREHERFIEI